MSQETDHYVGFDLETAKIMPENANWKDHRPLGITVAALAGRKGQDAIWGVPVAGDTYLDYGDRLSQFETAALVSLFQNATRAGRIIATWNGLGFDWQVLAEESGLWDECRALALSSIDMMYHVFCVKGFPLGLKAAAKGMGVGTKMEGVDGAQAPYMWQQGDRQRVIDYCIQDAVLTRDLAVACQERGGLTWRARSGRWNVLDLPNGWLTVAQARELPAPDTSWMDKPLARSEFDGWLEG